MSDEKVEAPAVQTIYRIEMFCDNRGLTVKVQTPVSGGKTMFIGLGMAQAVMKTPEGPVAKNVPIDFPIEAENIAEAFAKYEESAQEFVKTKNQRSRIIQATSMPPMLNFPPRMGRNGPGPGMIGGGAVIGG